MAPERSLGTPDPLSPTLSPLGRGGRAATLSRTGLLPRSNRRSRCNVMLYALLILLSLAILVYGVALVRAAVAARAAPGIEAMALGAVVNFFDTLGIGSFATTTAWFKFRRMVPDRLIPQTMLCGLTPPAMTEG